MLFFNSTTSPVSDMFTCPKQCGPSGLSQRLQSADFHMQALFGSYFLVIQRELLVCPNFQQHELFRRSQLSKIRAFLQDEIFYTVRYPS